MTGFVLAAFFAGLVGSPHCVGMCGGFAVACGGSGGGIAPWHSGRLLTYAVLGAVAGSVGAAIPGPGWVGAALSGGLIVWFAAALAGVAPEPRFALHGFAGLSSRLLARRGYAARFGFGLANGLLPCGLVYAALSIPVATGSPLVGAGAMLAFGAGTIPALTAFLFGARRLAIRSVRARRAVAVGVLIAGLWSVGARQGLVPGGGHEHGEGAMPGDATATQERPG